jgi:hypothetical protein
MKEILFNFKKQIAKFTLSNTVMAMGKPVVSPI